MSLKIGIVGCGAIHSTHADAIDRIPQAQVSGFLDVVYSKAEGAADRFCAPAFGSLKDLIGVSDAISVCVPSGLHAEIGIQAAAAGKHVLVEKPIDVSLAAARRLVDACRSNGVKLSVISQHRFANDIRRLKSAADEGLLGPLIEGDAYIKWYRTQAYYDSGDWRGTWALDGGGCLINQGIHYIDMIQWIMGGVKSVQAVTRTCSHSIEVEDIAAILVEYKNGAIGVIQGSTSIFPGLAERLEVHGKHGTVIIEGDLAKVWEIDDAHEGDDSPYGRGVRAQPVPSIHLAVASNYKPTPEELAEHWIEQHREQFEDFVSAVLEDREPSITGEMALEPLKVILAIYKSARSDGAKVALESL